MEPVSKLQINFNLFLIGFMGCGKTTVADALHRTCRLERMEMDRVIEEREGMRISELFAKRGEAYFRGLESALLTELRDARGVVVSCGGGTPMRRENVAEMQKSGKIILLKAAPETIYERVKDNHDRPLLDQNKTVPYIKELMEQRREAYEAAADLIIETDGKTAEQICTELLQKLDLKEKERGEYTWQNGSQDIRS